MEGYRGIWEDKEGVEKKMEVLSYVGVKGCCCSDTPQLEGIIIPEADKNAHF